LDHLQGDLQNVEGLSEVKEILEAKKEVKIFSQFTRLLLVFFQEYIFHFLNFIFTKNPNEAKNGF
jgi:hypothetical protein